ncbi:hypothetical protein CEUSTIGMA_g5348.t1 [Chlamydomonas eustigma]|uniref:RNA 3'-terminal-phosphate cyclase (ATP) n=1 Tax=Chlamydomonas eustigma TaxID=1157962 RepID=A0A250X4C3_9CHLO|nr:hypothetical protein CEUSTIGMA_g5348.t1 [Chlamydomonas eustigma]|eukprot:GAX77906.1 hypothetical protein CEUSTIGMA_g5348.t1 [Chlamydomonas eustigma]
MAGQSIHIDGSIMEGGGQILRNAAALSAITKQPITICNIRAGRKQPGLRPQHLTGLNLVSTISQGSSLTGCSVGSNRIELRPGKFLAAGDYVADTLTAGSCTLMVQQALPCLLFAVKTTYATEGGDSGMPHCPPSTSNLTLRGGTDADMAPPIDYLTHVLVPTLLHTFKPLDLQVRLVRRGFMPKGGGEIKLYVQALERGTQLPAFDLTARGNITKVQVRAYYAGHVTEATAQQMADEASKEMRQLCGNEERVLFKQTVVKETTSSAVGDGYSCSIVVETDTGCILGAALPAKSSRVQPKPAAGQAVEELKDCILRGACVDQWMQDQLIIYMALAEGESKMLCTEPTLHTRTAITVVEKMLPGVLFQVSTVYNKRDKNREPLWMIRCKGAGLTGRYVQ